LDIEEVHWPSISTAEWMEVETNIDLLPEPSSADEEAETKDSRRREGLRCGRRRRRRRRRRCRGKRRRKEKEKVQGKGKEKVQEKENGKVQEKKGNGDESEVMVKGTNRISSTSPDLH
jgi:hypothetical protein